MAQTRGYCPDCDEMVLAKKEGINHVLHLLITLFLCGMWLPIWLIAAMASGSSSYQCTQCGHSVQDNSSILEEEVRRLHDAGDIPPHAPERFREVCLGCFDRGLNVELEQEATSEVPTWWLRVWANNSKRAMIAYRPGYPIGVTLDEGHSHDIEPHNRFDDIHEAMGRVEKLIGRNG